MLNNIFQTVLPTSSQESQGKAILNTTCTKVNSFYKLNRLPTYLSKKTQGFFFTSPKLPVRMLGQDF